MKDLQNKYVTVEECVKYFRENNIRNITLAEANKKFIKALNDNTFGDNVIERNNIIYIKKEYLINTLKTTKYYSLLA